MLQLLAKLSRLSRGQSFKMARPDTWADRLDWAGSRVVGPTGNNCTLQKQGPQADMTRNEFGISDAGGRNLSGCGTQTSEQPLVLSVNTVANFSVAANWAQVKGQVTDMSNIASFK